MKHAHAEEHAVRALARERDAHAQIAARDPQAHTWVATVVADGADDAGRPWLALPWFEHSLRTWLDTQPPPGERVAVLVRALACVEALHRTGDGGARVHRDLKPDNFLVAERPLRVVLADLGATREDGVGAYTTVAYTPRYAPAEQPLATDAELGSALDVHALGVLVYFAFAGVEPDAKAPTHAYRAPGLRLLDLSGPRALSPDERRERDTLRRAPLAELLDLGELCALTARDEARLRNGVLDTVAPALAERDALPLADAVVAAVVRAVSPEPAERGAVGALAAPLHALSGALGAAGFGATVSLPERPEPPATGKFVAPASVRDDDPMQRDPLAAVLIGVLALCLLGLGVAVLVGGRG